ncbi:Putative phage lysozyme [Sodalis praecaptivus]|uniref:Lysozyme n=1 Tax=Sodalis praecaptivus TaxID=1239307 RepID=W0HZC4_9GAMM|nr:glycoside hydrolase family protein [Sodalis praecaptivus]AHF77872.1 Putative phage lysozyme [Sodalis praecaptivus]
MSQIIPLLNYEEGYREMPYYDSLGYPTAGTGILLGPKGTPLSHYTFTVPKDVSDVWLQNLVKRKVDEMQATPDIAAAMKACNGPRQDILISMAYQMGVNGLAKFTNTLALIAAGNFTGAAAGMLNSAWARQTPSRAKRHAEVMRTGVFATYQGLL